MNKENQKKYWKTFGIFFGILVFFVGILFGMIKFSQNNWTSCLKNDVQDILNAKSLDTWKVGKSVQLKSAFSTSSAVYEALNMDSSEKCYAIIIRITTLYGHMPAVFVYNQKKNAEFIGYVAVKGRIKTLLEENYSDSSVTYWLERIPNIINEHL